MTTRNVGLREDALNLQRRRFEGGVISEFDLRQLEAETAAVRAQLPPLERARDQEEAALTVLLGRSPRQIFETGVSRASIFDQSLHPAVLPPGMPSELLLRRPDLVEAERHRCCPCQAVRLKPEHTGVSMRPVPWHVKGVHPDARDVAREAARRSGLSVGAWLNSLIIEAADKDVPPGAPGTPAPSVPSRNPRPTTQEPAGDHVASIGRQTDELKWRIDTLSRDDSTRHAAVSAAAEEMRSARLAEAIARIDSQLERLGGKKRAAPAERNEVEPDAGVDAALAEITARQHALDDEFAQPQLFDAPAGDPADKSPRNEGNPIL